MLLIYRIQRPTATTPVLPMLRTERRQPAIQMMTNKGTEKRSEADKKQMHCRQNPARPAHMFASSGNQNMRRSKALPLLHSPLPYLYLQLDFFLFFPSSFPSHHSLIPSLNFSHKLLFSRLLSWRKLYISPQQSLPHSQPAMLTRKSRSLSW